MFANCCILLVRDSYIYYVKLKIFSDIYITINSFSIKHLYKLLSFKTRMFFQIISFLRISRNFKDHKLVREG